MTGFIIEHPTRGILKDTPDAVISPNGSWSWSAPRSSENVIQFESAQQAWRVWDRLPTALQARARVRDHHGRNYNRAGEPVTNPDGSHRDPGSKWQLEAEMLETRKATPLDAKFKRHLSNARREIKRAVERASGVDLLEGHKVEALRQIREVNAALDELDRAIQPKRSDD